MVDSGKGLPRRVLCCTAARQSALCCTAARQSALVRRSPAARQSALCCTANPVRLARAHRSPAARQTWCPFAEKSSVSPAPAPHQTSEVAPFFAAGAGGRDRAATVVPAFETTDVETTDGGLDFRVMRRFLGVEAPEQPDRARGMSDKSHGEGPGRSHFSKVPRCVITQIAATTNNTTLGKM